MPRGRIEQVGTAAVIYEVRRAPFVFDFLGRTNSFNCEVEKGKAKLGDKILDVDSSVPDGAAVAFVRPANVVLSKANGPVESEDPVLPGTAIVRFISALGPWASVELLYDKQFIEVEMVREKLSELQWKVGDKCAISVRFPKIFARRQAERQVGDTVKTRHSRMRLRRPRQRNYP